MAEVYNSAYKGSEIDAAVKAVKDKENTWDGKQDALSGVQGQVVGFDEEGKLVAQDAPSGLPAGGTAGQVLTKASDEDHDAQWQDAPTEVFIAIYKETPFADIVEAYRAGKAVFFDWNSTLYTLYALESERAVFSVAIENYTSMTRCRR